MQQIVILGGGAAGLAAALAAAQSAPAGAVRVTVLDRNPRCGKKLLATGNGRCNLDNTGIAPEQYFTADPAALRPLLAAVDAAAPLEWFAALGLYTRTDEAGRVYPYSNQAADVLALLEGHLARLGVEVRTGCTVQTLSQNRSGYTILCENAEGQDQTLRADAVICAMGGNAGPQFGTDGFGTRFAAQCGGKLEPLYPCLTALQQSPTGLWPASGPRPLPPCWTSTATAPWLWKTARCSSRTTGFRASASCSCLVIWPRGGGQSARPWSWTSSPCWTRLP